MDGERPSPSVSFRQPQDLGILVEQTRLQNPTQIARVARQHIDLRLPNGDDVSATGVLLNLVDGIGESFGETV